MTTMTELTEAVTYAAVVTAGAFGLGLVVGVVTGGGLVHTKVFLFLVGLVTMAYATATLWPSKPPVEGVQAAGDGDDVHQLDAAARAIERSNFQTFVDRVPPVRWLEFPPTRPRWPVGVKLFIASVLILLTSFLMEASFGVT